MAKVYSGLKGQDGDIVSVPTDPNFNQLFVAAAYFTDSTMETVATPTAGTLTVEGKVNGSNGWSELDSSPLDCTDDSDYVSAGAPLSEVRVTCAGLDAGLYFQVTVTAKDQ